MRASASDSAAREPRRSSTTQRGPVGTIDDAAEWLNAVAEIGCERVMLQHLLPDDLKAVALIGRELAPAVA
jgi:hypothetical protein